MIVLNILFWIEKAHFSGLLQISGIKNDGLCFDENGTQDIYCRCLSIYSGPRCEINLCDAIECENGGICTLDQSESEDQLKCDCIDTFGGPRCELNLCDDKICLNGGICVIDELDENEVECDCPYGFDGENCDRDICGEIDCGNAGNCTIDESDSENLKPKCDCSDDFVGETCDIPLVCFLGDPCQNGGECQLLQSSDSSDQDCFILIEQH